MTSAADYLGSELCLTACLHAIGDHKQAEACSLEQTSHVISIMKRQPQPDAVERGIYQRCVGSINSQLHKSNTDDTNQQSDLLMSTLLECFGNVQDVVQQNKLKEAFVFLSLPAIQLWGASSNLRVDSENSVAVLLNAWWIAQPASVQTSECKIKLSALVRLPLLTYSYLHYVINKQGWFAPPVPEFKAVLAHIQQTGKNPENQASIFNNIPRLPCKPLQCTFDWVIPLEALQKVARPGFLGSSVLREGRACWKGFSFWLRLSRSTGEYCLQIEFGAASYHHLQRKKPAFALVDFEVQSSIGTHSSTKWPVPIGDKAHWVKVLQLPHAKTQDIATELAGKLDPNNNLLVTAIVSNIF